MNDLKRKFLILSLGSIVILLFISIVLILPKVKEAQNLKKDRMVKYHFALYYADENAPQNKKMFKKRKFDINKVVLEEEPFLTEDDITYYDWNKHQFSLNKTIPLKYELNYFNPFFLLVNGKRKYMGFVNAPFASFGPPGGILLLDHEPGRSNYSLTLVNFYKKDDIEKILNDETIYKVLKDEGKLKE